jgi:transcriptional regulator with XRE-family HTH domain
MKRHLLHTLGYNIRAERFRMGYTQEELAEKSGFHRTYIGEVEKGVKDITVHNCSIIARALCVPLSALIHKAENCLLASDPDNQEASVQAER